VIGPHARLRAMLAVAQTLSLGALAAAVMPIFLGAPAPLAATMAAASLSVALGLLVGHLPGGRLPQAADDRLRAGALATLWAALFVLLRFALGLPQALVLVWAVVGFTASLAAFGTARVRTEDAARSLVVRSALAALVAALLGALLGRGPIPPVAALGLLAVLSCLVTHAVARAHYRAVDADRVSRSAAAAAAVITALAIALAVGPVHSAAAAVLGLMWAGCTFALEAVAYVIGFALWGLILLVRLVLHPTSRRPSPPSRAGLAKPFGHGGGSLHAPAALAHLAPFALLAIAGAIAVWLVGRIRHGQEAGVGPYRDEILGREAIALPPPRGARRRPPRDALARVYAEALGVLAAAAEQRAHPQPAETPSAVVARLCDALSADVPPEAAGLFARLTAAYERWRYADAAPRLPDPPAHVLASLRRALPPARPLRPPGRRGQSSAAEPPSSRGADPNTRR
jgi:hypothetical protein